MEGTGGRSEGCLLVNKVPVALGTGGWTLNLNHLSTKILNFEVLKKYLGGC